MFGKKKQKLKIELWGDGKLLYRGNTEELPLNREAILKKSEEFFSDPNPCYIHETAVRIRLTGEIEERLKEGEDALELARKYSAYSQVDRIVVY